MRESTTRDEALSAIEQGESAVLALLGRVPPDELSRPATIGEGEWSAKDLLGHLTSWEELALRSLREWRAGETPWIVATEKDVDEVNADAVAARATRSLDEIRSEHLDVHASLVDALARIADSEWSQAAPYEADRPTTLGTLLGRVLGAPLGPFRHVDAHLADLRAFAEEHGGTD